MVSGVPHATLLGQLLKVFGTSKIFFILEYKFYGYDDYSTLIAVVQSPLSLDRAAVAETLNRDLYKVSK